MNTISDKLDELNKTIEDGLAKIQSAKAASA